MQVFEVVYAKKIEAYDFFDAVDRAKEENEEILTISVVPPEVDDDEAIYDG